MKSTQKKKGAVKKTGVAGKEKGQQTCVGRNREMKQGKVQPVKASRGKKERQVGKIQRGGEDVGSEKKGKGRRGGSIRLGGRGSYLRSVLAIDKKKGTKKKDCRRMEGQSGQTCQGVARQW